MGYTTEFEGHIDIKPPLAPAHMEYINQFSGTRRMKRDAKKTELRRDSVREAAGLPVGLEGGYFVGEVGHAGQDKGIGVLDQNEPPSGQPGLWCQWEVSEDRLYWDGGEKFYDYSEWLAYLIEHFFEPWGYVLNGRIFWQGEQEDDIGQIDVRKNTVNSRPGPPSDPLEDLAEV